VRPGLSGVTTPIGPLNLSTGTSGPRFTQEGGKKLSQFS
jgi:hypothetical protein